MMEQIPLVGSVSMGYGENAPTLPTADMPNLTEATQDFVSVLFSYMFEQMRSSMADEENGLFSGEQAGMFLGFLDQEIGKKLSRSQGATMAAQLSDQLTRNRPDLRETGQPDGLPAALASPEEIQQLLLTNPGSADPSAQILEQITKINGV